MVVTIFENITTSNKPYRIDIPAIVDRIGLGNSKDKIEEIRKIKTKAERDVFKRKLPSICFSGIFSKRANDAIISHTGFLCIDFDHVDNLIEKKKQLCKDRYTHLCFVSPSGDGLKLVIRIPDNIETHKLSCRAVVKYYNDDKLDSFEDIARVCYESYDPQIYYNPNSEIFKKLVEEKEVKNVIRPNEIINNSDEIIDRLEKWLEKKGITYTDGNKHKYLVKLSAGCLRFGVNYADACSRLRYGYSNRAGASKVDSRDIEKIVSGVYKNYSHNACTAHFEKSGKPVITVTKKEIDKEILDFELPLKDVIFIDNVKDSMIGGFKTGYAKGKTTMMKNLAVVQAKYNNEKFAWFGPEEAPADDFYNDLIHTYVGKSTEPYHNNQMSYDQYLEAMDFIGKHFFYIYPEDNSPTPEYINLRFKEMIKKYGVKWCVTDPFNQLDNDWKKHGRDDQYISVYLGGEKRFAQEHDIIKIILAHPSNMVAYDTNGTDKRCPDQYNLAGGAMWSNKCDNILFYHRPNHISNPEDNRCIWRSSKIKKRKLTGVPGDVTMFFDYRTNRFYEADDYCPFEGQIINEEDQVSNFYEKECPF